MNPRASRGFWVLLGSVASTYLLIQGAVSDLQSLLTVRNGGILVALLLAVSIVYVWPYQYLRQWWHKRCSRMRRLEEARALLTAQGGAVLVCAQASWLYRHANLIVRVSEVRADGRVVLDIHDLPLSEGANLDGVHFAIIGHDKGERGKGQVVFGDRTCALVELYERGQDPEIGDQAVPIQPGSASSQERLLGELLALILKD